MGPGSPRQAQHGQDLLLHLLLLPAAEPPEAGVDHRFGLLAPQGQGEQEEQGDQEQGPGLEERGAAETLGSPAAAAAAAAASVRVAPRTPKVARGPAGGRIVRPHALTVCLVSHVYFLTGLATLLLLLFIPAENPVVPPLPTQGSP